MKLLHPFIPFITEEIYKQLNRTDEAVMVSNWPEEIKGLTNESVANDFSKIINCISTIRSLRQDRGITPSKEIKIIYIKSASKETLKDFESNSQIIKNLAKVKEIKASSTVKRPKSSAREIFSNFEIFLPLEDLIDIEKEKKKLKLKIVELEKFMSLSQKKLKNKNFIEKAPKEIIKKTKEKSKEISETIKKAKLNLKELE